MSHELGWPVSIVKESTTLEQFTKWQAYFHRRKLKREKIDWYLASISHSIAQSLGGSKSKLEDHLLRFEPPKPVVTSPEDSKAIWLAMAGITI